VLEERKGELERYLQDLAKMKEIDNNPEFTKFIMPETKRVIC
jgi:hypothetical protein